VKVEVTNDAKSGDGFQITFSLVKGLTDYNLLLGGTFDPGTRVIIVSSSVHPGSADRWHHHSSPNSPSNDPGMSTLTVTASDLA